MRTKGKTWILNFRIILPDLTDQWVFSTFRIFEAEYDLLGKFDNCIWVRLIHFLSRPKLAAALACVGTARLQDFCLISVHCS